VAYKDHYETRMQAISGEVARLKREQHPLCFLGDSLTEKNNLKSLGRFHVVNMGISGDMMEHPEGGGLLNRLWLLPMATPSYVLILIGVNDLIYGNVPTAQFHHNYNLLLAQTKDQAKGAPVSCCMLLPVRDHFQLHRRHIAMANVMIEELADVHHIKVIDTYSPFMNDLGEMRSDLTTDGLHLNADGYLLLNSILESELATA
jgi:lysophospholipase L1-like esterase